MRDPLDELKNFTAGTPGSSLPAAEVRRRGDHMRRRRTALQALGATAAVAVIASGGALAAGVTSTGPRPLGPAAPTTSASPSPTTSPSPSATAPAVASEIPEDFPLDEGIDVPEGGAILGGVSRNDATDQSWRFLPCTGADERVRFPGDEQRTAARFVGVEGDAWGKSRQLFVYEDFTAAERAFTELGAALTACAETDKTAPGSQPMDWSAEHIPGNEDTPAWVIVQGTSTGDPSHAFFVDLTATQVGRSVFVSWSGRGQEERLDWQRLEDSHEVVLRAAWCLWMEGPCGDETPGTAVTDTPSSFDEKVIARGLPEPGGDVPEWTWTEGDPLSAVACGRREDLPSRPVSSTKVEVSPPDANAWRQLLVFDDEKAASAAMDQLRSSAVACNEVLGTSADDPTDPSEMRWATTDLPGTPEVLAIDGRAYADGTEIRVPGRVLTRAVQVGRAVLVGQVADASSNDVDDAVVADLVRDLRNIAGDMCTFADGPCDAS